MPTFPLLGVGEAASAEEITQQPVSQEEPAYGRYETEYAHREREREAQRMSILTIWQQLENDNNLY